MTNTDDKPAGKSATPAPGGATPPPAAHPGANSGNSHSKGATAPAKDAPTEKSWSHLATAAGDGKNTIPKKR